MATPSPGERLLLIAPVGKDAAVMADVLKHQGFDTEVCNGTPPGAQALATAGALVCTEEALERGTAANYLETLKAQPPWSELPLIILASSAESQRYRLLASAAAAAGSFTLLERPIGTETLVRSVEVALRSRRRQYQVRDLLEEQQRRQRELAEAKATAESELAERRRTQESLARRVRELTALYLFTDKLQRAGSLDELYGWALDSILSALNCQRVSILIFDAQNVMRFVAWRGLSEQYRRAVEGHSPWTADAKDPKPIYIPNAPLADLSAPLRSVLEGEGIQALAFIPLVTKGRLIGKFMTYYDAPHEFTTEEQDLALTVARQLGFGIERKRGDEALRESEERYRTLVAQVKDYAIFAMDREGCATSWNEGVERVLGFQEAEFVGRNIAPVIFTPEDVAAGVVERELRQAAETGTAGNDRWMRRKDGTSFFATGVTTGLRSEAGELIGYTKVLRDNTAAKEAHTRLAEAQEQLRQHAATLESIVSERTRDLQASNEQLEAFVYSIAHDLRAPLRTVTGYSQLLSEDYASRLDATGQHLLQRIHSSSEFMDKLLLALLTFGRAARAPVELGSVEVQKAWEAALLQCGTQIEQTHAEIEVSGPLPLVIAHEATLGQCLANLLSNALKFVPAGVAPHVRFWNQEHDARVRLWVEDNGVGIPPEQHHRVFRVFEQLQGSRYPGTGIGLSIVRKGVERMGGTVGVESEPSRGSKFWIELPKAA